MIRSLVILFLVFSVGAQAAISRRVGFENIRALGMGNAFIGLSDDETAIWNNPAQLARNKKTAFHLIDFDFGFDSMDTFNRMVDAVFGGSFDNAVRTDTQFGRLSFSPTFVFPFFATSFFIQQNTHLKLENMMGSEVDILSRGDLGVATSVGLPIGKLLSIGATVRYFLRTEIDVNQDPTSLLLELGIVDPNDFLAAVFTELVDRTTYGSALGLDFGANLHVPVKNRRTKWNIGATVKNFGNTTFTAIGSNSAPSSVPMTINFGSAISFQLSRKNSLKVAVDWRDFFGGDALFTKLHAGAELNLSGFSLRAGYYQGAPAYGASFRLLPHTRIHFASYRRSDGNSIAAGGHRWYSAQVIIGFNPI